MRHGPLGSVARTLELVGERWTLLIVRDAFLGVRRFGDFADRLGIARNVLQDRLERLVQAGLLIKVPYQARPLRHEYRLIVALGVLLAIDQRVTINGLVYSVVRIEAALTAAPFASAILYRRE